jgi:hypothetical protein
MNQMFNTVDLSQCLQQGTEEQRNMIMQSLETENLLIEQQKTQLY